MSDNSVVSDQCGGPLARLAAAVTLSAALTPAALAGGGGFGSFDSGSDGSDGALVLNESTVINLGKAAHGSWDMPAPIAGNGVYDSSVWAVVYKYESVTIAPNVQVSFINHPSGAPVVWLVQGDVTIGSNAVIHINGESGSNGLPGAGNYPQPAPGGFAGGAYFSNGFGPGGGDAALDATNGFLGGGGGGGFAEPGGIGTGDVVGGFTYGNIALLPLIGGSGGGGDVDTDCTNNNGFASGGAGGGAILIAASGSITMTSAVIQAYGGDGVQSNHCGATVDDCVVSGGGSGGGIKLMANSVTVTGSGALDVRGGDGGQSSCDSFSGAGSPGRIRIEAFAIDVDTNAVFTSYTSDVPGDIFPDAMTPVLRAVAVNGNPINPDPGGGIQSVDGVTTATGPVTLEIEAQNIAPGSTVQVTIFQAKGNPLVYESTPLSGNFAFSTATAEIQLNSGIAGDIVLRVQQ